MTAAKVLILVAFTALTSQAIANTPKCDHMGSAGLFANTNPKASKASGKKVAVRNTSGSSTVRSGTR